MNMQRCVVCEEEFDFDKQVLGIFRNSKDFLVCSTACAIKAVTDAPGEWVHMVHIYLTGKIVQTIERIT